MNHRRTPPKDLGLMVLLAGYNGDIGALRSGRGDFTPETLSAAYARISRSPEPVPVLRQRAREEVEQARRSNRTIVFGLGHHSVAEHAVLNFDILGCSRLAIEALEWHRLCSFTEKSQRYITLNGDHVVPIEMNRAEASTLCGVIEAQNQLYFHLLPLLEARLRELHPELDKQRSQQTVLEGWAKEDARYVVSLATTGQLGFTCNARNLELVIRRTRHHHLEEVRRLGQLLFEEARTVVPSLIVLADEQLFREAYGTDLRDRYLQDAQADLQAAAGSVTMAAEQKPHRCGTNQGQVTMVDHTPEPDVAIISALLFAAGRGSLEHCLRTARCLSPEERSSFVRQTLVHLSEHDSPPRAFEEATFRFELTVDASAMAQLKRHRMATQHWGPYDPDLGVTVPPAVDEVGEADRFTDLMEQTSATYLMLKEALSFRDLPVEAATYALTNAHRRRVSITMNLRELYHFSRLREDGHAQWAIRQIANDLSALVSQAAPVTSLLLGGKDRFQERYAQVMYRLDG